MQQHGCCVLVFFRIGNIVHRLCFADLLTDIVHGGLHQWIHGCYRIIQIYKRHRVDMVFVNHYLNIQILSLKLNGRRVYTGFVLGLPGVCFISVEKTKE